MLGLPLLRLGTGGVLAAHGAQKLFGWFGGHGLEGTGQFIESVGYAPRQGQRAGGGPGGGGRRHAARAGPRDARGGAAAAGGMAGASAVHVPNGFFAQEGGYEHAATLGLAAAGLAVTGPGRLSLDHALGHVLDRGWMVPAALGATAAATAPWWWGHGTGGCGGSGRASRRRCSRSEARPGG